jgi:hypothetical protein
MCSGSAAALFSYDLIERGIQLARSEFFSAFYFFSTIPPVGISVTKYILLLLLLSFCIVRLLVS